ncbi:MAG: fatty acid desaturase [Deltaproteobacteria bacterium]|nr:fatty acid desaturase [Deltaproteobacteria bacterium]
MDAADAAASPPPTTPPTTPPPRPAPHRAPPALLNQALALLITAGLLGLQWGASGARGWALLAYAAPFALLGLPLYTLMHESFHRCFHDRRLVNDLYGVALSALFPGPFSFMRMTHAGHHGRNRTDVELFDGYYPQDKLWWKFGTYYFLFLGGFWSLLPLVVVLMLVYPPALYSRLVQEQPESAAMVNGVPRWLVRRIRLECALVVAAQGGLLWLAGWDWVSYLALYAAYGFAWSSQNYITHSGSPRHVLNGAFNLQVNPLYSALILHFNWHLAHHQHPSVPWLYLPQYNDETRARPSYLGAWLRQWRGPRPCAEPCPRGGARDPEGAAEAR